ncbi:hypothetical protein B0J11DRAFT_546375 [Dendryphion nanum]|uniref:Protein phosphatase 4 core regulatory subunit R2 n=1 Tax=Dendryphion nanum TaxID=256645 RepID=A0A9P9EKS1_9PLEO|nr:hypothetical protein B0J11DRAFT_546375 [Dendryphion nanum]
MGKNGPRPSSIYLTIVTDFPRPNAPLSPSSNANTPAPPQNTISSQESETTDKENAPPATPPRPPVPAFAGASSSTSQTSSLPPDTVNFYASIRTILSNNFPAKPPHTIQRLAELVLHPKKHYRFLPSYLRALDRVVSVTSTAAAFPLELNILPSSDALSVNGNPTPQILLGSDESLGGALLTPIPWLQNNASQSELISESTEIVEGPNGAGRIETVSVISGNPSLASSSSSSAQPQISSSHPDGETLPYTGAVTQGEILRQEQEAGIVLSNPHSITVTRTTIADSDHGDPVVDTVEGGDEAPHARGPEVIGMEDTGPQKPSGTALNIEGAVGRPSMDRQSKSPGPAVAKEDEDMEDAGDEKTDGEEGQAKKIEGKDVTKDAQIKTDV